MQVKSMCCNKYFSDKKFIINHVFKQKKIYYKFFTVINFMHLIIKNKAQKILIVSLSILKFLHGI